MRDCPHYSYSVHSTSAKAEAALDNYFAADVICENEQPFIKTERRVARDQKALYRTVWCVMFPTE
jgi:hypothetical protein